MKRNRKGQFVKVNPAEARRAQERAYGGVHVDIDVNSHNLPGRGKNAFRTNPRRSRLARLAHGAGRVAGRAAGAAYTHGIKKPVKRAVHRRLSALADRFKENPQRKQPGFFVQEKRGTGWFTLGIFPHKAQAVDYAKAIKRRHPGHVLRVFW